MEQDAVLWNTLDRIGASVTRHSHETENVAEPHQGHG